MYKLLLAEESEAIINKVLGMLDDRWEVRICRAGYLVKEMLFDYKPDAMVVNLSLDGKSSVNMIADCFPNLPFLIVAMGSSVNSFMRQHLGRWGVDYVLEIDSDMGLLQSILHSPEIFNKIAVKRTAEHLRVLGVHSAYVGYTYLLLAIPYISEDTTRQLHKDLYGYISNVVNAEAGSIEHAIRTAVMDAWKRYIPEIWGLYFPLNKLAEINCPNNKEFISALALKIR